MCTAHGEILVGEKLANLENLPKFSLPLFTDTLKMYVAYALTVTYSAIFSLPIPLTYMVHQKFSPAKILLCTVLVLKYF